MPPSPATSRSWYLPSISFPPGWPGCTSGVSRARRTTASWPAVSRTGRRDLARFQLRLRRLELRHRGLPAAGQLLELVLRGLVVGEQLVAARRVVVHGRVRQLRRPHFLLGFEHADPFLELRHLLFKRTELRSAPLARFGLAPLARLV